tara:strand:- start:771 stop:977 length:207 start_codon:yes stop_codon:yes gene_type:complete
MFSEDINFMESYVKDSLRFKNRKVNISDELEKDKLLFLLKSLFESLKNNKLSPESQIKINEIKILYNI